MNLTEELTRLADESNVIPDADLVLRKARARKRRTRTVVPLLAAATIVLLVVPFLGNPGGAPPAASTAFVTLRVPADADINLVAEAVRQRVIFLGLGHGDVSIQDSRTLVAGLAADPSERTLSLLAAPQRLTVRKVLGYTSPRNDATIAPSSIAPSSPGVRDPATTLADLAARLGPLYAQAEALEAPSYPGYDTFNAFAELTAAEVGLLPARMQFMVSAVSCQQLNDRLTWPGDDVRLTVCDENGNKLLLDVVKATGADFGRASLAWADLSTPVINLEIAQANRTRWDSIIAEAYHNNAEPRCTEEAVGGEGRCLLAFLAGRLVLSAPEIQAEYISGPASVSAYMSPQRLTALTRLITLKDVWQLDVVR